MKNRVYIFTANNVVSLTNPENLDAYRAMPNALVNPDVSHMKGVKREFWKLSGGKVVEMSRPEKMLRMREIAQSGAINDVGSRPAPMPVRLYRAGALIPVGLFALGLALGVLLG